MKITLLGKVSYFLLFCSLVFFVESSCVGEKKPSAEHEAGSGFAFKMPDEKMPNVFLPITWGLKLDEVIKISSGRKIKTIPCSCPGFSKNCQDLVIDPPLSANHSWEECDCVFSEDGNLLRVQLTGFKKTGKLFTDVKKELFNKFGEVKSEKPVGYTDGLKTDGLKYTWERKSYTVTLVCFTNDAGEKQVSVTVAIGLAGEWD